MERHGAVAKQPLFLDLVRNGSYRVLFGIASEIAHEIFKPLCYTKPKPTQEALIDERSGCHSHPAQLPGIYGSSHRNEKLHQLLEAAMSGPSCVNAQDWSFVVVTDPEKLAQMADANGRPAQPLRKAAAGILVCGDLDRAFRFAKDYWVIDGAIAAQNICLAAQELGLGAVWLGTWPQMDRVETQKKLFALPETIVPHSIIALGYPEADITAPRASRYEADRVHFNQW